MGGGGKSGAKQANAEAAQARADEEARQSRIRAGTASINETLDKQFTPEFYQGRRDAYTAYATPQLQDQYKDAQEKLVFALARGGNLDSSVRADKTADLTKLYDLNAQNVATKALDYETQARNQVADARSALINELTATGNAEQASRSAVERAGALSAAPAFDPLSNIFAAFTEGLGYQAAQERAEAMSGGAYKARYNTGLFAPRGNAVSVTGG